MSKYGYFSVHLLALVRKFCALKKYWYLSLEQMNLCGCCRRFGGLYTNSAAGRRIVEHPGYGLSQCYTSVGFGFQGCTLPYITLNTVQSSVHEPEHSEQDVRNCGATVKTVATQSGERSQCKVIERNTMAVPPLAQTLAI